MSDSIKIVDKYKLDLYSPEEVLKHIKNMHPDYDKFVNKAYFERGKSFPEYCFIPLELWPNALGKEFKRYLKIDNENHTFEFINEGNLQYRMTDTIRKLAVVATWSYSKSIYKFDPDLFNQLKETKISNNIPSDVLLKMPEFCIYIETPDLIFAEEKVYGFFAIIEHSFHDESSYLTILLNQENSLVCLPILNIGDEMSEFMQIDAYTDANGEQGYNSSRCKIVVENTQDFSIFISLVLYICSENFEYVNTKFTEIKNYEPVKVKSGFRIFQPSQTRIKKIGEKVGEAIRKFKREFTESEHSKMRPHMRRAHWHGYWIGKKGAQEFKYNWIPPTFINNLEEEAAV